MKKRVLIIIGIILLVGLVSFGVYFFSAKEDRYSYTVDEQRWLDENKNEIIDFYMPSNIASLTMDGKGLFFDFVEYFTKNTKIKINPVAYQIDTSHESNYGIELVSKKKKDDITFLEDNYVILTKDNIIYNSLDDLEGLKLGLLANDAEEVANSLGLENINYVTYNTKELMLNGLDTNAINGIIVLKSIYLNDILTKKYHVAYQILDMERDYVLRLSNEDKPLYSIIKKEFAKFKKEELKEAYYSNLFASYVEAYNISEKEITNLNSKTYTYGYISNGLYDNTSHNTLMGINYFIIKDFADFANIDMNYKDEYNNLSSLKKALDNKQIDFYFDNTSLNDSEEESGSVKSVKAQIVYLTKNDSKLSINNLNGLKNKEVLAVKNSKIEKYLLDNKIKVKSYDNYPKLFKNATLDKNTVIAMELGNYEYYKTRNLSDFHISFIDNNILNYGFMFHDNNKLFKNLFDFYLEFVNIDKVVNIEYANAYEYEGLNIFLFIAVVILSVIIIIQFFGRIKKFIVYMFKHKKNTLTKDEKLKYIDDLTSLKNRAYLNANIDKWDNSEIYPQIIIIIDLNNIAYINDNFGHEEGDKVITEAANILIQTQMANTEIIRTDGNEFLIYMVDYEEKKAVSYIRKLKKEFKNLTHGFGAAIGYSIINDAIKTIDDAVNEATLDMKTNKELMNEEEK